MSGRHAIPSRLGHLYREVAKFGVVGLAGVVVNVVAFNLIQRGSNLQTVRASVLATLISIVCNYLGFRYFTYRGRDSASRSRELGLFLFFSLVGMIIENSVLFAATYGLSLDSVLETNFFKFVGVGVATVFRFWSYRTWVFKAVPAARPEAEAEDEPAEAVQAAAHQADPWAAYDDFITAAPPPWTLGAEQSRTPDSWAGYESQPRSAGVYYG